MENITINFSNLINTTNDIIYLESGVLDTKSIIRNICTDWSNYSVLSHHFYFKIFLVYWALSWLMRIYNPHFIGKKHKFLSSKNKFINSIIKKLELDFWQWDIEIVNFLRELTIGFLFLRIVQVYLVMVI